MCKTSVAMPGPRTAWSRPSAAHIRKALTANAQSATALSYEDLLDRNESVMDAAKSMGHPIAKLLVVQTRDRLTAAIKAENVRSDENMSPRAQSALIK